MNKVTDKQTAPHYIWGNNCDSWILADTAGLSVKQETMPAGAKGELHFHSNAQQFFFILKGRATLFVEDAIEMLTEQQGLLIKPGAKHFIANESSEAIDFLVISQPGTNNDRVNL